MASAQEVEMLRRQLDELTAQMMEIRQQSSSTAMNAAVSGLAEAVRNDGTAGVETAPRRYESRKARAVRTWQRIWRLGFHIQRIRGYARSCLSCLAENSETITNSGGGDSTCCTYSRCSHRKEHVKWWEKLETTVSKLTDNCAWCTERPIRKAARIIRCKSWLTSSVPRLKTWKTVWTNVWNWDDTMRRTVLIPFPDQVKKPCIVSRASEDTSPVECWKTGKLQRITPGDWRLLEEQTHLQDDFSRKHTRWRFNGSRCCLPKRKGKEKSGKGKKGGKKGKEIHSGKGYGETTTERSRFDGECRNCGKYGHKASDCWYKQPNKSQGKGRARESRNPRWQKSVRVTSVNMSMIGILVQTRPHRSQIYLKWTRLDAQMRDSGYFHWKTARNVVTRWIVGFARFSSSCRVSISLIHNIASDGKLEQVVTQHRNEEDVGNLSNCNSDICCLCCPTMEFSWTSTSINELMVDGLLANVGIGSVLLFCSSSLVKEVPVPVVCGTDPVCLGVAQ